VTEHLQVAIELFERAKRLVDTRPAWTPDADQQFKLTVTLARLALDIGKAEETGQWQNTEHTNK